MNKLELKVRDGAIAFFVGFLFCQLAVLLVLAGGYIVASICHVSHETFNNFFDSSIGYLLLTIAMDLTMFLIFIFYKKTRTLTIFKKPSIKKCFLYFGIAVISYIILTPIISCWDSLLYKLGFEPTTLPYELTTANFFLSILTLVILPAVCEELLFRGVILNALKPLGKFLAIILCAVMFSIFHMSIWQLLYPILLGFLLSAVALKEGNIIYTIIIHATNNLINLTIQYFDIVVVFSHWLYTVLAFALLAIFLTTLIIYICKIKLSSKINIDSQSSLYLVISIILMIIIWIASNIM